VTSAPSVLHVATTDMSLELLLGPQLSAFRDAGYRVLAASAPGPYVDALRERGVEHLPLHHATRSVAPGEDLRAVRELVTLFRRTRPTIVHTHNPKPGIYGRVAARIARVPVIVNTVHGLYALPDDRVSRRGVVYALERGAATCSHVELVQNEEDLATLRQLRVPGRKLVLLGNGIDLTRFDPGRFDADAVRKARLEFGAAGPSDVVVGTVGRLVAEKGYHELFAAAESLRRDAPDIRVAVIGFDEPDKADSLTADDVARATADGVRFLGARHDVDWLYTGMDVFVLASHREGFPRAAMEAAAMGIPIVATDIRGCRQVVEHGVTGLLVPARNPVALAEAIGRLAADPPLRAAMGDAGRQRAARLFDQQHSVDITLSVYESQLRRRGLPLPVADGR
jgi:glycosyltransferase involved in cell wall biosynthesis